ncbi:MAG TPA: fibronectin/fibrinogen-binding protein [Epulopiscium sp.]|nr:fibronectin/fibrinogen-binding protein [Candidatus Epulonipiscium sp.]
MALDGIVLSNIVSDFRRDFIGGRILKIYQTEKDELVIGARGKGENSKILLTAHSNYPRLHSTTLDKDNPQSPPMFCMLLRKHIGGGRITDIVQPNFERIVEIHIESSNELGDLTVKKLVIEIMGRHSNIMLLADDDTVIDSIKHIGKMQSSVRQIYPGKTYVYPPTQDKHNPLFRSYDEFLASLTDEDPMRIHKRLYTLYSGMSPLIAKEICYRAGVESSTWSNELKEHEKRAVYESLDCLYKDVEAEKYSPAVYKDETDKIVAFSSVPLSSYEDVRKVEFENISALLEHFYFDQSQSSRVDQKTVDMKKVLDNHYQRAVHKKEIQLNALEESSEREQYRIWGELITANAHCIPSNQKTFTTVNYYDEAMGDITIPLNPHRTPIQNAQKYFKIYNKAKRTEIAAHVQLKSIEQDLLYLDSLFLTLDTMENENDIAEFRAELVESGYLKAKRLAKSNKVKKPKPLHFVSDDGFDIYVGKNNVQNDQLTLKMATNYDLWFHTKDIPGSHVIIDTARRDVPETTLIQAALLAAYYSKAKDSSNVPVDYTEIRNVRKPNGAKPGMVIYDTNKTLYVTPEKRIIDEIKPFK